MPSNPAAEIQTIGEIGWPDAAVVKEGWAIGATVVTMIAEVPVDEQEPLTVWEGCSFYSREIGGGLHRGSQ